jgi:hypothetical protein
VRFNGAVKASEYFERLHVLQGMMNVFVPDRAQSKNTDAFFSSLRSDDLQDFEDYD